MRRIKGLAREQQRVERRERALTVAGRVVARLVALAAAAERGGRAVHGRRIHRLDAIDRDN